MPKLIGLTEVEVLKTPSHFGFSGKKLDALDGTEYTLAGLAIDTSGSTAHVKDDLAKAYRTIVGSCRSHPKADSVLLRGTEFNDAVHELHGFVNLTDIEEGKVSFSPSGSTALFDAALEGIEAIDTYAAKLIGMDYLVNGVMFVVTDGQNCAGVSSPAKIKAAIQRIRHAEKMESLKTILVGVGDEAQARPYLETFQKDAGLDQFIWIGALTKGTLAKLADFVSRSISVASLSLGTGGPSVDLKI